MPGLSKVARGGAFTAGKEDVNHQLLLGLIKLRIGTGKMNCVPNWRDTPDGFTKSEYRFSRTFSRFACSSSSGDISRSTCWFLGKLCLQMRIVSGQTLLRLDKLCYNLTN